MIDFMDHEGSITDIVAHDNYIVSSSSDGTLRYDIFSKDFGQIIEITVLM